MLLRAFRRERSDKGEYRAKVQGGARKTERKGDKASWRSSRRPEWVWRGVTRCFWETGEAQEYKKVLSKAANKGGKHKQSNESKPFKKNGEEVGYLKGAPQIQRWWISKKVSMKSFDEDGQEFVNFLKHLGKTIPSDGLTSCSWALTWLFQRDDTALANLCAQVFDFWAQQVLQAAERSREINNVTSTYPLWNVSLRNVIT